jgi:hypothetical protein
MSAPDRVLMALRCVEGRLADWSILERQRAFLELSSACAAESTYSRLRTTCFRDFFQWVSGLGIDPDDLEILDNIDPRAYTFLLDSLLVARAGTVNVNLLHQAGIVELSCFVGAEAAPVFLSNVLLTLRISDNTAVLVATVRNLVFSFTDWYHIHHITSAAIPYPLDSPDIVSSLRAVLCR